jgi:hypothetical protein
MPFYNTSSPTPSTKNNITDIAVTYGARDFLLNKNLLPVYPQISTSLNGSPRIGEPVLDTSINGNANVTPFGLPLEVEGILRYELAVLPNQFKNYGDDAAVLQNIDYVQKNEGVFGDIQFPNGIQSYPQSSNEQIKEVGIIGKTEHAGFRKKSTLYNLYLDSSKQIDMADFISLQPAGFAQQIQGYADVYGGLNRGNTNGIQAVNIIGSVLNGQGLGLAKGGVVTNFDFRASLAGRVLGSTGLVNDTKLGLIGGQQLALALANNAAFNAEQILFGGLNIGENLLALVKGGPLPGLRPNYKITMPSGALGKTGDYTARILGFTIPKSYLSEAGSIFSSENQSGNIERANSMIENTGKGQALALIANANANLTGSGDFDKPENTQFRSGYAPGYLNNKGQKAINPNLYAFYDDKTKGTILNFLNADGLIPSISYNRSAMISEYGFKGPEETFTGPKGNTGYDNRKLSDVGFTWTSDVGGTVNTINEDDEGAPRADLIDITGAILPKTSLLVKTQKLFRSAGMKNIVTAKGEANVSSSQILTSNNKTLSKGSAVLSKNLYDVNGYVNVLSNPDSTFCRSWTTIGRYDSVKNLIRHKGVYTGDTVPYRFQTENLTLDEYGFPKIAPYTKDKNGYVGADPKKFMFSIENLAWADESPNLPPVEIGMGDLLSGKKGRIMWFPPYNIQFNETSAVNWESTNFIGRGEPIYTYNNTERSGNLSFSIIVDHPSYINGFRNPNGPDDNYVASFFAGCIDPASKFADKLTVSEKSDGAETQKITTQEVVIAPEIAPDSFTVYFPNDGSNITDIISKGYENGLKNGSPTPTEKIDYNVYDSGYGIGSYVGGVTSQTPWVDDHNYGLNGWRGGIVELDGISYSGFSDPNYGPALAKYLDEKCPHCIIRITSYASPQGNPDSNKKLADARTESIKKYLINTLGIFNGKTQDYIAKRFATPKNTALTANQSECITGISAATDTFACKSDRRSSVVFEFSNELAASETIQPEPIQQTTSTRDINTKIKNRLYDESRYFEQLTDKDKFVFDSFREKIRYFHPAFHSTTPEGLNSRLTFLHQCTRQGPTLEKQGANNLAFGRAPVCILRLGDFYNTKIVIDNIAFDYEPLVWDLNPEGIGVQPMIANVNMSFKFIGGSSLMGPIQKLQNALSFNYYANAQVYDPRADYIDKNQLKNDSIKEEVKKEVIPPINVDDTNPIIDQKKANDEAIKKNIPLITQTQPDINKIISVKYGESKKLSGDYFIGELEIVLSNTLSKNYNFRLYLIDPLNSFFKRELGVGVLGSNTSKKYFFANSYDGLKYKKSYLYYISIEVLGNKFGDSPWISNYISKKEQEQWEGKFGGFEGGLPGGGGAGSPWGYN